MKKIKIETIEGRDICFDKTSESFIVDERVYSSFSDAKDGIKKDLETEFKGEFFVSGSRDGIVRFTAQRKIYVDYEGKYKIIGKLHRSGRRGDFEESELYPVNEHNEAQEKKAKKMDREGWDLINKAKRLVLKN